MAEFTVVRGGGGDLREVTSARTPCVRQEPRRNSPAVLLREVEGRRAFRVSARWPNGGRRKMNTSDFFSTSSSRKRGRVPLRFGRHRFASVVREGLPIGGFVLIRGEVDPKSARLSTRCRSRW